MRETRIVIEGHIAEKWIPYIENNDPTNLTDEEVKQFDEWFEREVHQGWISIHGEEGSSWGLDDVSGKWSDVYKINIIDFE